MVWQVSAGVRDVRWRQSMSFGVRKSGIVSNSARGSHTGWAYIPIWE